MLVVREAAEVELLDVVVVVELEVLEPCRVADE